MVFLFGCAEDGPEDVRQRGNLVFTIGKQHETTEARSQMLTGADGDGVAIFSTLLLIMIILD